jgi:hypothetical protein
MKTSSELFERAPKSADPKPADSQNESETDKPISTRTSHLSDRDNEFNRSNQESANEPEPAKPGSEPEVLTVEEMLEMEDAELKSYGIDDPKTWKSYQRLLHKKEAEWKQKEKIYEETLAKLKVNQPARREEPDSSQEPKAPLRPPVKPRKPANYDYTEALSDPQSESGRYLAEIDRYREEKDAYQDAVIANLTGYVSNEQQAKILQRKREEVKSMSISRFQQRGMGTQEASDLFDKIERAYMSDAETGADIFVSLFKGGRSNGSDAKNPVSNNAGKRKLPDNIIMPPGVNTSTAKPAESSTKSFMQGIEGANQARRIILNREKRK